MFYILRYFNRQGQLFKLIKQQIFYSTSPTRTALSVLFGFYLGIFPVIGMTTILCFLASYLFKLNYYITLTVNYLVAPLQLLLIVAFIKIGHLLFESSKNELKQIATAGIRKSNDVNLFSQSIEYVGDAVICWGLLSATTGYCLYRLFLNPTQESTYKKPASKRRWFYTHFWQND